MRSTQAILTVGALFTCSTIARHVEVRDGPVVASAESLIASLESAALAQASGVSLDLSGVPTSVYAALSNPTAIQSLIGDFASSAPAWYTSLAPAAQSYILAVGPKVLSIQTEIASLEGVAASAITNAAGIAPATTAAGNITTTASAVVVETAAIASNGTVVVTGNSTTSLKFQNSTVSSTKLSSSVTVISTASDLTTTTSTPTTTSTSSPSSSSSSGIAAQQTAALAASFFGAIGVLGLAVAL